LGFELLNMIVTQNFSILDPFDAENISLPLNFYDAFQQSRIFGNADQEIIDILSKQPVTMNNHHYGVSPSSYTKNQLLNNFFRPISWSVDRKNVQFVSTIEGIKYPIYGLQWHAEKPLFEWTPKEVIQHSAPATKAMQYMADFFVSEARKSEHHFATTEAEGKSLIYNYQPTYSAQSDDFVQIYFFD